MKKQTCTGYKGRLTTQQQGDLLALLWGYMREDPGYDRVATGYGTKTKTGLLASIEGIVFSEQEGQWQPTETAPKDGTEILICYPLQPKTYKLVSFNVIHGYWQSKGTPDLALGFQLFKWQPLPNWPMQGEEEVTR